MVPAVAHCGVEDGHTVPQDGHGEVGPHDQRTGKDRHEVHEHVLQRVAVHGDYSDRCRPLVVCLVDVLVEEPVVAQPEAKRLRD